MALPDESLKKTLASDRALTGGSETSTAGREPTQSVSLSRSQEGSVSPERWQQIRGLYERSLECEAENRPAFLQEACQGDSTLLSEVKRLLAAREVTGGLLDAPALGLFSSGKTGAGNFEPWLAGQFQVLQEIAGGSAGSAFLASSAQPGDSRWTVVLVPRLDAATNARQAQCTTTETSSGGHSSLETGASQRGAFLTLGQPQHFLGYGFLEIGVAFCSMGDWQGAISPLKEACQILQSASAAGAGTSELILDRARACRQLGIAHSNVGQLMSTSTGAANSDWTEARRWLKESSKLYSQIGSGSEDVAAVLDQIKAEMSRCDEALQAGRISRGGASKAAGISAP